MNKKLIATSVVAATILVGCGANKAEVSKTQTQDNTPKQELQTQSTNQSHTISFSEVPVPMTDKEKRKILASKYIEVDGEKTKIRFRTIAKSGDKFGENTYGLVYDKKGQPISYPDGSLKISHANDFASLLPVGDKLYMVSHFETSPAAMYLSELSQSDKGELKVKSTKPIDFSKSNGLWVPCAGSVTPWNTHLGSEEYEPDASKIDNDGNIAGNKHYKNMAQYFGGDMKAMNPYDYGWIPEVIVNEDGSSKAIKHYAMGRFAHELAYVMPDQRTVYLSDDGTNVALFMFVADHKGDLSSGTLYAAKWEQRSKRGAGRADIKWVNLGHSSNRAVRKALKKKVTFKDIFKKMSVRKDGTCAIPSFTPVNTTFGPECLKVKTGMDELASRLESRRYAAIKGATTEFRKMEGITHDPKNNILYVAMSAIGKGMEDNKKKGKPNDKYDRGGNNDIQLKYNKCGAIYGLNMISFSTPHATDGSKIDSQYVTNSMYGVLMGEHSRGGSSKIAQANKCQYDKIANPDNITFIPNTNTMIIGEDTGSGHQNDFIWSYNLGSKELTRIQTTPYGSETTSPYFYNNIGGYGYLMSVVQHPFGEGDATTKEKDMPNKAKSQDDFKAYTGYIGPLPVINK
jgi:secreted PhoX family phosphatase